MCLEAAWSLNTKHTTKSVTTSKLIQQYYKIKAQHLKSVFFLYTNN